MHTVSAADLARNTHEILDKVACGGETVAVERNHTVIAHIVPLTHAMTATQALAGLTLPMLTQTQASAWFKDSRQDFGDEVRDPWT